ncbi:MAG: hypothetical protein R2867_06635 [Caldilineaceae bacterium]
MVMTTDNLSIDFGYYQPAQFGDRVWIESDSDGDVTTGVIVPVHGHGYHRHGERWYR